MAKKLNENLTNGFGNTGNKVIVDTENGITNDLQSLKKLLGTDKNPAEDIAKNNLFEVTFDNGQVLPIGEGTRFTVRVGNKSEKRFERYTITSSKKEKGGKPLTLIAKDEEGKEWEFTQKEFMDLFNDHDKITFPLKEKTKQELKEEKEERELNAEITEANREVTDLLNSIEDDKLKYWNDDENMKDNIRQAQHKDKLNKQWKELKKSVYLDDKKKYEQDVELQKILSQSKKMSSAQKIEAVRKKTEEIEALLKENPNNSEKIRKEFAKLKLLHDIMNKVRVRDFLSEEEQAEEASREVDTLLSGIRAQEKIDQEKNRDFDKKIRKARIKDKKNEVKKTKLIEEDPEIKNLREKVRDLALLLEEKDKQIAIEKEGLERDLVEKLQIEQELAEIELEIRENKKIPEVVVETIVENPAEKAVAREEVKTEAKIYKAEDITITPEFETEFLKLARQDKKTKQELNRNLSTGVPQMEVAKKYLENLPAFASEKYKNRYEELINQVAKVLGVIEVKEIPEEKTINAPLENSSETAIEKNTTPLESEMKEKPEETTERVLTDEEKIKIQRDELDKKMEKENTEESGPKDFYTIEELKEEMNEAIKTLLEIEEIKKLKPEILRYNLIKVRGGFEIVSEIKINKTGVIYPRTVTFTMNLPFENRKGELALGQEHIEAGNVVETKLVKMKLGPRLESILPNIQEHFERKLKRKIDYMTIENGGLKLK